MLAIITVSLTVVAYAICLGMASVHGCIQWVIAGWAVNGVFVPASSCRCPTLPA